MLCSGTVYRYFMVLLDPCTILFPDLGLVLCITVYCTASGAQYTACIGFQQHSLYTLNAS